MTGKAIHLGVVMDPIEKIKPVKDTTLAMLLAAQARGWRLSYMRQEDLAVLDGVATGTMRPVTVRDDPEGWFELGPVEKKPLAALDVVLMRKDPPFDMEYIYTTYILERAEQEGVLVVNRPRSLRDVSEKAYTTWFPELCPSTLIARSMSELRAFAARERHIVVKPLDGMGGRSIFVIGPGDPNTSVILETITAEQTRFVIAQKYIPEISRGDKRVLLVDGEPVPYALARIPAKGESRGNLAAGATAEGRALSDRDREICAAVAPTLKAKGLIFVGLDIIGDYLTEINVTSPTCIRELDKLYDLDIAAQFMDAIEAQLAAASAI